MRTLDRYVTSLFLLAAGVFIVSLLALFLIIDFTTKAGHMFALKRIAVMPFVLKYYGLKIPLMLFYVLPSVTLFASVFTLLRLSRNNELVPLVTAGRSLRRVALPFLIAALVCGGAVMVLEEFVLPKLSREIAEMDEVLIAKEWSWQIIAYDRKGYHLYAMGYDHVKKRMHKVSLVRIDPPNVLRYSLEANSCIWNKKEERWIFEGGTVQEFDEQGNPYEIIEPGMRPVIVVKRIPRGGTSPDVAFRPEDLRSSYYMSRSFQPFAELQEQIKRFPEEPLFRIQFHTKISFPLAPLVLLLIGMPFVVAIGPKGMVKGMALCLIISVAYYLVTFAALDLGKAGTLHPIAAAWASTATFGLLGLLFFSRMRT